MNSNTSNKKKTYKKICKICGIEFNSSATNKDYCGKCTIDYECPGCKENIHLIIDTSKKAKLACKIKNGDFPKWHNKKCELRNNPVRIEHRKNMQHSHKEFCEKCQKETTFLNGIGCMSCHNKSDKMKKASSNTGKINIYKALNVVHDKIQEKLCPICGEKSTYIPGIGCMNCHNQSDNLKEINAKRLIEAWQDPIYANKIALNLGDWLGKSGMHGEICKNKNSDHYNEKTLHCHGRCFKCNPWDLNSGLTLKYCDNCEEETLHNGYKCVKCNDMIIGMSKRFCNICNKETLHNGTFCCICFPDKKCGDSSNFIEKDGKLYYNNILWEDYKKKFDKNNLSIDDFDKYNGIEIPTYRTDEYSRTGQDAMEQELVEKGIGWFVYIKFYIDKNNCIKPLVVGKSGSKLVNKSGTDIMFDYVKPKDKRPGRIYLKENKLKWYTKSFYLIPCKSEIEALLLESEIKQEYNLFFS